MGAGDARSVPGGLRQAATAAAVHGPGPLRHVAVTGSTNDDLAAEARAGDVGGVVLVADHQTAGRGRLDRRWDDEPGRSLLVSLRVPAAPDEAAGLVLAAGSAARAAIAECTPVPVLAKWPNDLVVDAGPAPGKLAGVLAEYVAPSGAARDRHDRGAVVVGIGVNLDAAAGHPGATSVAACGGRPDRDAALAGLLREFAARRGDLSGVLDELRRHSATVGRRVRIELPGGGERRGLAVGLDDGGRLVVRGDDGIEHVVAVGDVVHLRSL